MTNRTKHWIDIKKWLKVKNYYIGSTHTGWTAVSRNGIVITTSISRVKVEWSLGSDVSELRCREATLLWMKVAVSEAERDIESTTHEANANNAAYKKGKL